MYDEIYKTYKKVADKNIKCDLFNQSNEPNDKLIDDIKKNKIVIYTAFTGDYDTLKKPEFIDENCDYICYTDNPNISSDFWEIRLMEESTLDNNRKAKQYKVLPHKYLSEYKYSFWLDGTFKIKGSIREYIYKYLKDDSNILCVIHTERNCAYKELKASKIIPRYPRRVMEEQMDKYENEGFPENYGLPVLGAIFREHNDSKIIKLMEDWWNEIIEFSNQDQLSFSYVAWKNNIHPSVSKIYYWNNEYWAKEGKYHHKVVLGSPVTSDNLRAKIGEEVANVKSQDSIELSKEELYLLVNDVKGLKSHDHDKGGRIGYYNAEINSILHSKSFKITKPLRKVSSKIKSNPYFYTLSKSKLHFNKYLTIYKRIKASGIFKEDKYREIHSIENYNPILHYIYYSSKTDDINTKKEYIDEIFDFNYYLNAYEIGDEDPIIHYFSKGFFENKHINNLDSGYVKDINVDFNYQHEASIEQNILNEISNNNYITNPKITIPYSESEKTYDTNSIKVGIFLEDTFVNMNACPYLRLHGPLKELSKSKDYHFFVYGREVLPVINQKKFLNVKLFDIIIIQRISPYSDIILKKAKKHGIKIIYETDDDLLDISRDHPSFDYIYPHIKSIKKLMNNVDAITVSTDELSKRLSEYNNINVIRNYFANDILKIKSNNEPSDNTIKIGYFGTFTHFSDLELIKNVILILKHEMKKLNINVEFEVIGGANFEDDSWINRIELPYYPMGLKTFYRWLEPKIDWDIGIVPLLPSEFNRSKSELKYIEFTALGIPTVSSDTDIYKHAISDGINGFFANTEEEWVEKIEKLILDKKLREKIVSNAQKDISTNYRLSDRSKSWNTLFKNLMED
ncbi:glycosyltransferase domain-containing protein [Methanobrevibacter sp. DSM 116169]|uniref:glycosyltransferase domain-containing protein n=1 Tax=Methanobrevibacter sp. DSM 116169 TaxID=3242727 RepID=UPI0038FC26A4